MNHTTADDELLRSVLQRAEPAHAGLPSGHPDEETMALFVAGGLESPSREALIQHLAECAACRQWAAYVMSAEAQALSAEQPSAAVAPVRYSAWFQSRVVWAAAASLLLMVTGSYLYFGGRPRWTEEVAYLAARERLEAGDFVEAQAVVQRAEQQGLGSGRLRSLDAEADRRIPAAIALKRAGRLADFGCEIGGVVARDPANMPHRTGLEAAKTKLSEAGSNELEVMLNRGHLLLTLNEIPQARKEFRAAAILAPENPLVWLGCGLAAFLAEDYQAAEAAFRRCVKLAPRDVTVRINLAMTLEELDRTDEALVLWQELLAEELATPDRRKIEAAVQQLQERRR
jgi:tetratricopeptide (TPR) repeat protein